MPKFTSLTSRVIPLPANNIDTDQIIPARYLKVTDKLGLGANLFVISPMAHLTQALF